MKGDKEKVELRAPALISRGEKLLKILAMKKRPLPLKMLQSI